MALCSFGGACDFYPRSPCGERRYWPCVPLVGRAISIHALLAESDLFLIGQYLVSSDFYPRSPCGERHTSGATYRILRAFLSTLSLRRATLLILCPESAPCISIHALLAESDSTPRFTPTPSRNFYPRSPCGERPVTSVARVATTVISIHALLAESDEPENPIIAYDNDFYPRSPCGERLDSSYGALEGASISIHALLAESDYH